MTGTTPARAAVARSFLPAALALAVCLPAQEPAESRNQPAPDEAATDAAVQLGGLLGAMALAVVLQEPAHAQDNASEETTLTPREAHLASLQGPWIRNRELSEDPVMKSTATAREREFHSPMMDELGRNHANRLESILIAVVDDTLLTVDDLGDTHRFPLDGRFETLDFESSGRVLLEEETFSLETVAKDWLAVDTFRRQQHQLLRTTHLRSRALASVRVTFRTLYERPGSDPVADKRVVDRVGGFSSPETILIVPPGRGDNELVHGRVGIQTLVIDPSVAAVDFLLDGRRTDRVEEPPYRTRIELDDPPREQNLEVRAYGAEGQVLGADRLALNRIDEPFGVRIVGIRRERNGDAATLRVEVTVSIPRSATLERVDFYRSEHLAASLVDFGNPPTDTARTIPLEALIEGAGLDDYVRVTATLAGGRELEDAQLLTGADYQAEIDVHLVQLQVLVTDSEENPSSGLSPEDFEIRENGRRFTPEQLHTAHDIRLNLGLAIDSSESMRPVWRHLRYVADSFFAASLRPDDSAFLVDFNDTVRLLQPATKDRHLLTARLHRLLPNGGTALNDGLLFSLLQFRREPGRRALVAITDGVDLASRSRWEQVAALAERLGLPIYFVELDRSAKPVIGHDSLVAAMPDATLQREQVRRRLRRISRQTGGRHFHIDLLVHEVPWTARVEQAFDQIEDDLRLQHVLTYYTDRRPGTPVDRQVEMTRRGLKLRSVVALAAIE